MTATPAQIAYITDLRERMADHAEEIRAAIEAGAESTYTTWKASESPVENVRVGDAELEYMRATGAVPAKVEGRPTRSERRAATTPEQVAEYKARLDEYTARHAEVKKAFQIEALTWKLDQVTAWLAAYDADTATLDKDDASTVIDTIKSRVWA